MKAFNFSELAKDLYGDQGYCIIPDFVESRYVKILKMNYSKDENLNQIPTTGAYKEIRVKYIYKYKVKDELVYDIAKMVFNVRNLIALQPEADQFLADYIARHKVPLGIHNITEHQLSHTFIRIAKYKNREGQIPHYDNPSELQSIILLTEKGKDYKDGGLYVDGIDLDSMIKPGDLLILNAYKKKHEVKPIECDSNQNGRIQIFMPAIPEYMFAKGKGYYFFQHNAFKLYFSLPVTMAQKIIYYVKHFQELITRKTRPIDAGFKG